MPGAQRSFLADGRRLHLHHGPIDLIVDAEGPGRTAALRRAADRFDTILDELVSELPRLRRPVAAGQGFAGAVAQQMYRVTLPFAAQIVTPMAAVAGAVADAVLGAAVAGGGLTRAHVNNGGDIAFYLAPGHSVNAAIVGGPATRLRIAAQDPVRGLATSGWRGRSLSLGIADAVTVLAASAAAADAAATLIANHVDLPGHDAITRTPACDLFPDSDLGTRGVTTAVAPLRPCDVALALARGADFAETCRARGLIHAAFLALDGQTRTTGTYATTKDQIHA